MDDDDLDLAMKCGLIILVALTLVTIASLFMGSARASRPAVIVNSDGALFRGRFVGAEIGDPVVVMVDTTGVFGSGFE